MPNKETARRRLFSASPLDGFHAREREPNPDLDPIPIPPDQDRGAPIRMPPDQPGLPEEDQPDPPPKGDPSPNEPTRLLL
jgi:hypothetical protein